MFHTVCDVVQRAKANTNSWLIVLYYVATIIFASNCSVNFHFDKQVRARGVACFISDKNVYPLDFGWCS